MLQNILIGYINYTSNKKSDFQDCIMVWVNVAQTIVPWFERNLRRAR